MKRSAYARSAMRDGHSPSAAMRIADEMVRQERGAYGAGELPDGEGAGGAPEDGFNATNQPDYDTHDETPEDEDEGEFAPVAAKRGGLLRGRK